MPLPVASNQARPALVAGLALAVVVISATSRCAGTTTGPQDSLLAAGRWVGSAGVCLSVAPEGCDFVAGCGHGQFPRPTVHADGSFAVQGTYRIEVGPVSANPPPPARFNGTLSNGTLAVTVTPSDPTLQPFTSQLQLTNDVTKCSVPCV